MMQADHFSKYQSWFETEMECANGVCKRKQLVFWKTIGILLAVFARKIDQAIKCQGFDDARRERFAQEQMAVRNDPSKSVSLVITGGQDHMPAQFTLSEHYACLTGDTGFGPYIIDVDGTEAVRVTTSTMTLPALTRAAFLIIKVNYSAAIYTIQFIGHGKEQGRLQFSDTAVCEKVLQILCQRFSETAGR